jgi:adenine-specific DNA-methyltransferase
MKYMGSKRPLLDFIVPVICQYCDEGQTILDLFAGTHSVGYALKTWYRIIANDIQEYGLAIGQAIISNKRVKRSFNDVWTRLEEPYEENYSALAKYLAAPLHTEQNCLKEYATVRETPLFDNPAYMSGLLRNYRALIEQYPYYESDGCFNGDDNKRWDPELRVLFAQWIASRKADNSAFPYSLFSMYYSNSYFGIAQSMIIDSLRYAIDMVFPADSGSDEYEALRNICLSAMMYAASYCVAAPGHFAQFLRFDPQKESGYQAIFHHRMQSFLDKFGDKVQGIYEHECYCMDYRELLRNDAIMDEVDLVYADPPYTSVHYSRFYHILETLVRYDYPESLYTGRYRNDRHQSGFCQKSSVEAEFRHLIGSLRQRHKTLIISYPDTGLISLSQLVQLCRQYYLKPHHVIKENQQSYIHSTLGGKTGNARKDVIEALIVCTKPG